MRNLLASPWFPAGAWVACTLTTWVVVEIFCIIFHRRLISEVVWYLCANYAWQVAAVTLLLAGHFFTQSSVVYDYYRKKKDGV